MIHVRVGKTGCLLVAALALCVAVSAPVFGANCTPLSTTIQDLDFVNGVLDPAILQKFVTELPNPLSPGFIYQPVDTIGGESHYAVSMREITQSIGLIDSNGCPLPPSKLWAYGDARGGSAPSASHSYPGATFEARSNTPLRVTWTNELPSKHIFAIDPTLDGGPNAPNNFPENRAVVHVHGAHVTDDSDGLPEYWFTPNFALVGTKWAPNNQYGPTGTSRYPNTQESATLFYHDHAHGVTHYNVDAGLAGFYLVRDGNELNLQKTGVLPIFPYETAIALQDRTVDANGQVIMPDAPKRDFTSSQGGCQENPEACPVVKFRKDVRGALVPDPNGTLTAPSITPEFFGNILLVNGQAWPKLSVEPRVYRIRVLNGSDSRTYALKLNDPAMKIYQIGTEQGFLNAPVGQSNPIIVMPGERIDILIDFKTKSIAGSRVILQNLGPDAPYNGDPSQEPTSVLPEVMAFDVVLPLNATVPDSTNPAFITSLRGTVVGSAPPFSAQYPALTPSSPLFERKWALAERTDKYGSLTLTIDGKTFMDPVDNFVPLNATEVWTVANLTPDGHPLHAHLVHFQLINREVIYDLGTASQFNPPSSPPSLVPFSEVADYELSGIVTGPAENEKGWKDTIQMLPGTVTRFIATYDTAGTYVFHCHILSHEENDMMREFTVTPSPALFNLTVKEAGETGSGTVTSDPGGIICGDHCYASYNAGATVTLTAVPNPGHVFAGWNGGGCSGTGTCTVKMTDNIVVTAQFSCTLPLPAAQLAFQHPATAVPNLNACDPSLIMPIGVGAAAGGSSSVNMHIAIPQFTGPADLYVAVLVPFFDPNRIGGSEVSDSMVYLMKADGTLQSISSGIVPWRNGAAADVDVWPWRAFSAPGIQFPAGTYTVGLIAVPANSAPDNSYYLWMTSFTVQ